MPHLDGEALFLAAAENSGALVEMDVLSEPFVERLTRCLVIRNGLHRAFRPGHVVTPPLDEVDGDSVVGVPVRNGLGAADVGESPGREGRGVVRDAGEPELLRHVVGEEDG